MSSRIDSVGTYIFEIMESGLGVTSKNGFPQWIARLKAVQKYIDAPEEMKHFSLTAPAYVDWSSFDEDTIAYLVLFKSSEEFSKDTALLNYEQLQLATGWDGSEFDSIPTFVGKQILGRVQENEYEGKTSLRVEWIDHPEAPPERQLKVLDAAAIKGLSAKLKITKINKPAVPAKPGKPAAATKPAPTSAASAAKSSAITAPAAAATSAVTTPTAPTAPSNAAAPKPPSKKKTAAPAPAPAEAAVEVEKPALPTQLSQADAWTYIVTNKGGNEDGAVEDAWIAASQEVGGDKEADNFTNEDWAKVRDIVIRDLAL